MAIMIAALFTFSACDGGSSDDDSGATLTVMVNYLGNFGGDYDTDLDSTTSEPKAGTKMNYVHLYTDKDDTASKNMPLYKEFPITENGETIDLTGIEPGDYYVIASYDYRSGDSTLNQADRYAFYDGATGSPLSGNGILLNITKEGPNTASFNIQPYWELKSQQKFITSETTYSATITFDYSAFVDGEAGATNTVHSFLYRQLEPVSPRNNILYHQNLESKSGTVAITGLLPGTYFLVLLYDSDYGNNNIINTNDYYEIYDNIISPGNGETQAITITNSNVTIAIDPTSAMDFQIGSSAAWDTIP